MKVVVNRCYGGYGLSYAAIMEYAKRKGITLYCYSDNIETNDTSNKMCLIDEEKANNAFIIHYTTKPISNDDELNDNYFSERDIERNDPVLVSVVEDLGEKANGGYAQLEVVEIPDDVSYYIDDYDGLETIRENHRSW